MKMKFLLFSVLTSTLLASQAMAGFASNELVSISKVPVEPGDTDSDFYEARGSKAAARFSKNEVEYIGCTVTVISFDSSSTSLHGRCMARDASGVRAICLTEDADMIDTIRGISDYDDLVFAWIGPPPQTGPSYPSCFQLSVNKFSQFIPDLNPKKK